MGVPRWRTTVAAALVLVAAWVLRAWLPASWPAAGRTLGGLADLAAAGTGAASCALAIGRAGNRRARIAWCCQAMACGLWGLAPLTLPSPVANVGRIGFLVFAAIGGWLTFRG